LLQSHFSMERLILEMIEAFGFEVDFLVLRSYERGSLALSVP
jgi:hypothetical protein